MAYLKMVVNPADEMSVKRVINTPRRGIGSTSIAKIELLARQNRCSFFQACEFACAETSMFSAKVRAALGDFVALVREGRRMDGELQRVVEAIVEKRWPGAGSARRGNHGSRGRVENIQEFLGVAAEFEESHDDIEGTLESLEELRAAGVADLTLGDPPEGTGDIGWGAGDNVPFSSANASVDGLPVGAAMAPAPQPISPVPSGGSHPVRSSARMALGLCRVAGAARVARTP